MANMAKIELFSQEDLVKEINADKESPSKFKITVNFYLTQPDLKQLAQSNLGIQMEDLSINPEYGNGKSPTIDFSEVSFPNLKSLSIYFQSMKAIDFTKERTPILRSLSINQSSGNFEKFLLDLPELESMNVEHITITNPDGFGKSLSRSPKLTSFFGYKLWGLHVPKSKTHVLVLPNCETLDLYRSDDLDYIKIWAPKLEDLNLQACYSITEVQILDRKPKGYAGPEYSFAGTPSQYKVNLINTDNPAGNVTTHQRCKKILKDFNELMYGPSCSEDESYEDYEDDDESNEQEEEECLEDTEDEEVEVNTEQDEQAHKKESSSSTGL